VTQLRAEAAPVREVAGEDGAFVAAPPVPGAAAEADRVLAAARLAEHTAPSIFGLLGLAVAGLCVGGRPGAALIHPAPPARPAIGPAAEARP
jgi:hypothetical protein